MGNVQSTIKTPTPEIKSTVTFERRTLSSKPVVSMAVVILMGVAAHGSSWFSPKFGAPVVAQDALVFAGAGKENGRRIICINRDSGEKRWDIKNEEKLIIPWFARANEVIITRGSDIVSCSLSDGQGKSLFKTCYEGCSLKEFSFPLILVSGKRDHAEYLALIDILDSKKIWEVRNHSRLTAMGKSVVLCEMGERIYRDTGSYSYTNERLAAISMRDGSVLWTIPLEKEGQFVNCVAKDDFFVIATGGTIRCINQVTGKSVNERCVQPDPHACVTLVEQNKSIITWIEKRDVFSALNMICSLSVPGLVVSELINTEYYASSAQSFGEILIGKDIGKVWAYNLETGKMVWHGGQWSWNGIHDGWIYFSTMEENGTHTAVHKMDVRSGKIKKMYEETLPDSATQTDDDIPVIIDERK